jgi:hypothetical protein
MMTLAHATMLALLVLAPLSGLRAPPRQAPGYAEITQPVPGSVLEGIVTLRGSANHPSFTSYDLAFTYGDDTTGTWFTIGSPSTTPVVDGPLGLWDTSTVSPGIYVLRLRVFLSTGAVFDSQVRDLRIGLPAPETSAASPSATPGQVTPTPSALPAMVVAPPAPPTPANPAFAALTIGASMAAGGLLLFGAFIALRRSLGIWLGGLRMRRVLRGPQRTRPRS